MATYILPPTTIYKVIIHLYQYNDLSCDNNQNKLSPYDHAAQGKSQFAGINQKSSVAAPASMVNLLHCLDRYAKAIMY